MTLLRIYLQIKDLVYTGHRGILAKVSNDILIGLIGNKGNNTLPFDCSFEENRISKPSLK